jgi:hypothetical protein
LALGVLAAFEPSAAAAVVGVLWSRRRSRPRGPNPRSIDLGGKSFRWLVHARAYVLIRPIGHLSGTPIRIIVPDDMPLVWCMNAKGASLTDRVAYDAVTAAMEAPTCAPRRMRPRLTTASI